MYIGEVDAFRDKQKLYRCRVAFSAGPIAASD